MTFKNIIITILFSIFISACSMNQIVPDEISKKTQKPLKQPEISAELLNNINYILFLFKQNDLETLNKVFINTSFAYYELSKDENQQKIIIQKKLEIDEINSDIVSFEIKQEEAIFNCSPFDDAYYGWDKEGVFLTPSKGLNLSQLMKDKNLLIPNSYDEEEIKKAILIEKTSYEVIVPYNIVFHLTLIDNQWYITVVDKFKTDCKQGTSGDNN